MRLLVISQYFWPEDFRVNDFVLGMRERGHEVTVLTGLPNYPGGTVYDAYRADPSAHARFHDVEVVRVPLVPRGSNAVMLALNYLSFALSATILGTWKLRGRAFDAIFVFQTSPITVALPALLLRRLKRAPVLMWILDLWPETLAAVGVIRNRRLLGLVGLLVRLIYSRCDRILIQSQAFRDSLITHGARLDQIFYFPNWIEPTFAGGVGDAAPAPELAPHAGGFNLMFAGNIGEAQDMPAVMEAAALTRDVPGLRWLIVGDGRAADLLRSEIARHALQDRVILLGRHPMARMPAFMAGADALLVSLRAEPVFDMTVPGKVQSYLASGLPTLAMLDGEGARVVTESGGGLASPASDGGALAANVRRLAAMTAAERAAMGEAAQAYAADHFGRDSLFDAFVAWALEARREFR
ncbi:glycosyltransferase family 4 protein [Brevundimonas bacteroides]|uniref:glycosyltransferase family 4 protein n=1 Tax=Brevundimonas bacteroides TaxID=74311 RepID=UPI00054D766D|nr:glycosyltransferase family 4 protein [Brevundimonas bacteroides]